VYLNYGCAWSWRGTFVSHFVSPRRSLHVASAGDFHGPGTGAGPLRLFPADFSSRLIH
jgi:hypothetical protein